MAFNTLNPSFNAEFVDVRLFLTWLHRTPSQYCKASLPDMNIGLEFHINPAKSYGPQLVQLYSKYVHPLSSSSA
jgi:hypothetical protein